LESSGHSFDLRSREPEAAGNITPFPNSTIDFSNDSPSVVRLQAEMVRDLECQLERRCQIGILSNGSREHPRLDVGGNRVDVIGRRQPPAVPSDVHEGMIAKMIVRVRDQNVEYD